MRIIAHPPARKARLWLGDCPNARYRVASVLEASVPSSAPKKLAITRAAAEICIPTGSRVLYGLLGAEFTPEHSDALTVKVLVVPRELATATRFDDPLVSPKMDNVYVGLPPENAPHILDKAVSSRYSQELGSGVLCFDCAAHGLVGSCQVMFELLTDVVIRMLVTPNLASATDEQLADLVLASCVRENPWPTAQ